MNHSWQCQKPYSCHPSAFELAPKPIRETVSRNLHRTGPLQNCVRMPKKSSAYYALQVHTADASSIRYLYLKPHTDSSETVGAALFVAGLGVTYDESVLTELFGIFGAVSQVALHQNKVSASICAQLCTLHSVAYLIKTVNFLQTSALVVFASPSSLKKALRAAAANKALTVIFKEPTETFGLKGTHQALSEQYICTGLLVSVLYPDLLFTAGWVEQHKAKTPGNRVLQQQLDEWMTQWEAQESQRQSAAATDAADEGWTVVTKQRVSPSCSGKGVCCCIKQRDVGHDLIADIVGLRHQPMRPPA